MTNIEKLFVFGKKKKKKCFILILVIVLLISISDTKYIQLKINGQ